MILTADDGLTPDNQRLAAALKAAGDTDVTEEHMATDHSYSDKRIALESLSLRHPQAALLREEILEDADWAAAIDELNSRLS